MKDIHLAIGTYNISIGLSVGSNNIQYVTDAITFTIAALDKTSNPYIISYEAGTGIITNQMRTVTTKIQDGRL
jgi:hypothetical protein